MDIKVPGEAELLDSLAKKAKRDIHNYCQGDQTEKQQVSIHPVILCFQVQQSQSASIYKETRW